MADAPGNAIPELEDQEKPNTLKRIEHHVQSKTLAGLIELIPLLVTIVVILFIVKHADALVRPLAIVSGQPWDIPGVGLVAIIVVFYLAGLIISSPFGRKAMDYKSTAINFIPIVRTIFGITQQATTAMTSQYNFSRVVFLEWPREGMAAIGFVTGRVRSPDSGDSLVLVYIPTVPNPTSGNMALVLEDDVMETNLTVQDAMKLVFSGGIVLPDAVALARVPRDEGEHPGLIGRYEVETD